MPVIRIWNENIKEQMRYGAAAAKDKYMRAVRRACLDFCVLRHSMSTERDMYATQDDEESDSPIIGAAA
jgi:hypothetical protein